MDFKDFVDSAKASFIVIARSRHDFVAIYKALASSLRENPQGFSWRALRSNSPILANPKNRTTKDFPIFVDSMESICDFYKNICVDFAESAVLIICVLWIASSILADFLAKTIRESVIADLP